MSGLYLYIYQENLYLIENENKFKTNFLLLLFETINSCEMGYWL